MEEQGTGSRQILEGTGKCSGGGIVFFASGGRYKEVALQTFFFGELNVFDLRSMGKHDGNGDYYYHLNNASWIKATIYDLAAIYKSLKIPGKVH
jgi:hypothetical protein